MNVIIKKLEDTNIRFESIVEMMHLSFDERLKQGLNFTCSFFTPAEFQSKLKDKQLLLALDMDTGDLLGMGAVGIRKDHDKIIFGYYEYAAVVPSAKRCGVGSKILDEVVTIAKSLGAQYVMSDTAVDAMSSVKFHKKNGFKIVGLTSFPSTNYFSYIFRKQLMPSVVWNNLLFCYFVFLLSSIKTRIKLKRDGSLTSAGKLYVFIREKLCKK